MGKLINWLIRMIIGIIIIVWVIQLAIGINIYNIIMDDERPVMEQLGSGIKNINNDFQKGLNTDTIKMKESENYQ